MEILSKYKRRTARVRKSRAAFRPPEEEVKGQAESKGSEKPDFTSDSLKLGFTSTKLLNISKDKNVLLTGPHDDKTFSLNSTVNSQKQDENGIKVHDSILASEERNEPEKETEQYEGFSKPFLQKDVKTDTKEQSTEEGCGGLRPCGLPKVVLKESLRGSRLPVQRTNEAVWAAVALGFLFVLLTLSILHTRLYRHWRPPASLYWQKNQQDYESVAGSNIVYDLIFIHAYYEVGQN